MPATAQAPPKQQQPKQPPAPPALDALIAAVITALAAAATVAGVVAVLGARMLAMGISRAVLAAVAWLVLSWPADVMEGTGPATRWAVRTNSLRRARFFLAACKRVQAAVTGARSRNEPVIAAIQAAIAAERRYMGQQIAAAHQRIAAATAVDGMAATHGSLLGWNAVTDPRCTPECKAANRKNFNAERPPAIGYPGTTHPNCRCYPSKPFKGAPVLL